MAWWVAVFWCVDGVWMVLDGVWMDCVGLWWVAVSLVGAVPSPLMFGMVGGGGRWGTVGVGYHV